MVKINIKYRLQNGNVFMKPGVYIVDKQEAKKMLKMPYVTLVEEKEVEKKEKTKTKVVVNTRITNNWPSDDTLTSDDSYQGNDSQNDSSSDWESDNFSELSDCEIRALYKQKTGINPRNKKIETLVEELNK